VLPLVAGTDSPEFGSASRGGLSRKAAKTFAGCGVPAREALSILKPLKPISDSAALSIIW
jgi:hypothetical protein